MKISERAGKILRLTLSIATLVMLTASAVLFVISSISINATGASPYTYESIGAAFRRIAIPVYITLALVVASGIVLPFVTPDEKKRAKAPRDALHRLKLLYRSRDLAAADAEAVASVNAERRLRFVLKTVNAACLVLGVAVALAIGIFNKSVYLDGIGYHALTRSVVNVVTLVLICLAPALLVAVVRIFIDHASAMREYAVVEALPRTRVTKHAGEGAESPILHIVQISVLVLAAAFVVLGIFNGGMEDVVQKAIKICTECIGLG